MDGQTWGEWLGEIRVFPQRDTDIGRVLYVDSSSHIESEESKKDTQTIEQFFEVFHPMPQISFNLPILLQFKKSKSNRDVSGTLFGLNLCVRIISMIRQIPRQVENFST